MANGDIDILLGTQLDKQHCRVQSQNPHQKIIYSDLKHTEMLIICKSSVAINSGSNISCIFSIVINVLLNQTFPQ